MHCNLVRVARRRMAFVVPASLADQPAYGPLTEVVARHAGDDGAALLHTYWSCGDLSSLSALAADVGFVGVETRTVTGTASFPSAEALVATEIEGSPLIDRIDRATYERILADGAAALADYLTPRGSLAAPLVGHLVAGGTRG